MAILIPPSCLSHPSYYRTARAKHTTSTAARARPAQLGRAGRRRRARRVDVVDETDASRGGSARSEKAPATLPRRSARGRSRWRSIPGRRRRRVAIGIDQAAASSAARAGGRCMPTPEPAIAIAGYEGDHVDVRPGDPGDDELRGDMPRGLVVLAPSTPRRGHVRRRRRRSPIGPTRTRAAGLLHSAQRRTGHGPGAPQRSHNGGAQRTSRCTHMPQTDAPTRPQTAHLRGRRRSRGCMYLRYGDTRVGTVTTLQRLRDPP